MRDLDEQEYIRKVRDGEHAAYAVLVDAYKLFAFSIALKILGNEEEAQDAAQEGFIKAYQQIHQFEGKSKFSTWLYTIVYRTAIAQRKNTRIKTSAMSDSIMANFAQDNTTPQLVKMQSDDIQRHIRFAIDRLPETEGLLVMLYYINENSIREIQQITGLTGANIKIKLFRARKKLERELRFLL
ncbi:MAG TPA: sigma-70 family RNA polymerase sigma factor [Chryseolinea sp.]|nr:sigma-70 family RNA polymerase sigma factor [Chryseolinea sp.]